MKNIFLTRLEKSDINNFTSNFGIKFRRITHKPLSLIFKIILKYIYKKNVIVTSEVKLEKNKSYVFASNHSFFFDGAAIVASNDRNCYALFGATEQLYFDFHTFFIWISGLIYVNRFDKQSRKDSVEKMNRILKSGNSILIFPEGRWNDSENLLCQKLFAGPYNLSLMNNIEVVPVSVYNETFGKNIYVSYGKPLKLYEFDKDKGIEILRDNLATLFYDQIEKYGGKFDRSNVHGDIHYNYMDERMYEYSKAKWRSDYCWDDELFIYKSGDVDLEDVWKDIEKVKFNKDNVDKFDDILVELDRVSRYSFKNYMNDNYKKRY